MRVTAVSACGIRRFFFSVMVFLSVTVGVHDDAVGQGLPDPATDVILTLDGAIGVTNVGDEAQFDREMLMGLGLHSLETTNPFETGVQKFEGVLLRDILEAVKADGSVLVAVALDGYTIDIPVIDVMDFPVMVAIKWNGAFMSVRNRGPLWVVYPIDHYDALAGTEYSGRSIWQLRRLTVK